MACTNISTVNPCSYGYAVLPLSPDAKTQLIRKLGIAYKDQETIAKIISGYESNWVGFVKKNDKNPELYEQTHSVKGLKIYLDKLTDRLVADIAIGEAGHGKYKRAKCEYKIYANGICRPMARYTKCKEIKNDEGEKISNPQILQDRFSLDISDELEIRAKLHPIPHLLPLIHSGSYINKRGQQKERYEAPFCDGNVASLIPSISKDIKIRIQALFICRDAISALADMHTQGVVHKDLKPKNIFYQGCCGFLADLGFATPLKNQPERRGSLLYKAPEDFGQNSPQTEMFSVGATLLEIFRKDLYKELFNMQAEFRFGNKKGVARVKEFIDRIKDLQKKLLANRDGSPLSCLNELIANLINSEAKNRPSCAQTVEKLREIAQREYQRALDQKICFENVEFRELPLEQNTPVAQC